MKQEENATLDVKAREKRIVATSVVGIIETYYS